MSYVELDVSAYITLVESLYDKEGENIYSNYIECLNMYIYSLLYT